MMDEMMEMLDRLSDEQLDNFISFLLALRENEDNSLPLASSLQEARQTN